MKKSELKALVSLLDEEDDENLVLIENKIKSFGEEIIPFLEDEWENNANKIVQKKIENIIHALQFNKLKSEFKKWYLKGDENLLYGMYLCAKYSFPTLKFEDLELQIKQLATNATQEYISEKHPLDQVRALNKFFFTISKFKSNRKDFHNPNNSFVNSVLESKKGNPLSLAVVYMLVGKQLGMPLFGVNFPNLFILTYKGKKQFYINVYNSGLVFSTKDVDDFLKQLKLPKEDTFYQPCTHLDIVIRNIKNLIMCYEKSEDVQKKEDMQELLDILDNNSDK